MTTVPLFGLHLWIKGQRDKGVISLCLIVPTKTHSWVQELFTWRYINSTRQHVCLIYFWHMLLINEWCVGQMYPKVQVFVCAIWAECDPNVIMHGIVTGVAQQSKENKVGHIWWIARLTLSQCCQSNVSQKENSRKEPWSSRILFALWWS